MPRFFIEDSLEVGSEYTLRGDDARHISRSLRMRVGENLVMCTKQGNDCLCEIIEIQGDAVILKVQTCDKNESEPSLPITVYQCLPKLDKLEMVIQKSTELGAVRVVPVESSRCIAKLDAKQKKLERLQKIAQEASKQSGRGRVLEVAPPMSLRCALEQAVAAGETLVFYERGGVPLRPILQEISQDTVVGIFIGPEGGFSPEEVELAAQLGAKIITLGKRILRTETVALAVLSMILYERDEMQ